MSEEKAMVQMDRSGVQLTTLDEAYRFAQAVVRSGVAPQGDNPEAVFIKLQAGAELGMPPMRSLSALHVVNGRLGLGGEAALGKIRASGACEYIEVGLDGEGDDRVGWVHFMRTDDRKERTVDFSVAEAKKAKIWGQRAWAAYPDDMLIWRAVSRAAKRYFSDVLMGFDIAEVVKDYPQRNGGKLQALLRPPAEPDPLLAEIVKAEVGECPPTGLGSGNEPMELIGVDLAVGEEKPDGEFTLSPGTCPECGTEHKPSEGCAPKQEEE